jgi:hypothetical protein
MSLLVCKRLKTSGNMRHGSTQGCVLVLHFILTFWIFIVAGYVFSLPFPYSLRADKLPNSVIKTGK